MKAKTIIAALAAIAASAAFADKVTLVSGSSLTGETGAIRDGKVTFVSEDLGEIQIPVGKIAKLESTKDHVVQFLDGKEETKKVTVEEGVLVENGKELDMSKVKAVDPVAETWHGSVNLSATATRGNTTAESVALFSDVSRRWEHDRFTANAGYWFAQSGDSRDTKRKSESRGEIFAQEDHFWLNKLYSYLNGKYEFDRILALDFRYRVGAGLGYQWFEKQDLGLGPVSFNQEVGMAYVFERYSHEKKDNFATFRYAHHLAWTIVSADGLDFFHNFEYLPAVDEWADNYMINTDVGITYAFRPAWQLLAKAEWNYKSKVGAASKNSDIRYILGVGYKW